MKTIQEKAWRDIYLLFLVVNAPVKLEKAKITSLCTLEFYDTLNLCFRRFLLTPAFAQEMEHDE